MADGKYGTKAQRLRAAAASRNREQSIDDYVAMMLARKANRTVDDRRYIIRNRDGEYFLRSEATGWETVKFFAHWTRDKAAAPSFTLDELPKIGWIDLVCGFPALSLVQI